MPFGLRLLAPLFAVFFVAACNPEDIRDRVRSVMDKLDARSVGVAQTVRDTICDRSIEKRMAFAMKVNSEGNGYLIAADCDKDGEPDFPLQVPTGTHVIPPAD